MANLLQCIASCMLVELVRSEPQEVVSQALQRFDFLSGDIRAFVLLEPKNEEPTACPVRRLQGTRACALAAPWRSDPLLDDVTTQVRVNEAIDLFGYRQADRLRS